MSDEPPLGEQIEQAKAVQAKYQDELMQKPHVVGVSIGMVRHPDRDEDVIGIVVLVDEDPTLEKFRSANEPPEAERIPVELEGFPVGVQYTGGFFAG